MSEISVLEYGIDRERGLRNCMGKVDFYKKILSMFLNDQCFEKAKRAHEKGNRKELFGFMHELKGTSGNAALTDLYLATVPLVELLRDENAASSEIDRLFAATEKAYSRAVEGIRLLIA